MSGISISGRKISLDKEKSIIKNLITNTDFAKQIIPTLERDTFEVPHLSLVSKWIIEFFKQYEEAPGKTIQAIFSTKKDKMSKEDAELVSDLLESISNEFVLEANDKPNTQYLVKISSDYIKQRHYSSLGERLQGFSKLGDIKECEKALLENKNISSGKAQYINLHDEETAKTLIDNRDKNILFTIDGALGEMIGPCERGRLIGLLGKTGLGKSWALREFIFQGLLNKIKCVEFNFEMLPTAVAWRHYKRILGLTESAGQYLFPIFDCYHNAMGTCQNKNRKSKVPLVNQIGEIPQYGEHNPAYIPCDICRGINNNYKLSTWHEPFYKRAIDAGLIDSGVKAFKMVYGDNLRTVCFNKFSATVGDCEHQLDMMDYMEGFVPDLAIFDYDEIIKGENHYNDPLDSADEIYKRIGGMMQARNMCGFIGMQLNRTGAQKKKSSTFDVSGAFKKIMHLDSVVCLDQTIKEKENGIVRVSIGKMRDGDFKVGKEVKVLQQLNTGQSFLDSEWDDAKYGDD